MIDNQTPVLTAIVPIGDYERHYENINSIIESCNNLPVKLILVLDNQTESTHRLLETSLCLFANVNWEIRKIDARSPGAARNEGLRSLQTPWVAFWDSDDHPDPAKVVDLILESHPDAEIIIGGFYTLDSHGNKEKNPLFTNHEVINNGRLVAKNPGLWRMVFRASVVRGISFPKLRMAEDQIFLLNVLKIASRIEFSNNILYTYVACTENSLTNSRSSMKDLPSALAHSLKIVKTSQSRYLFIQKMMLSRIFFSTVKHGNFLVRISAIKFVLRRTFSLTSSQRSDNRKRNSNFVLAGGLGNQLFQLAAALNVSAKEGSGVNLASALGNPRLNYFDNAELCNLILPSNIEFNYTTTVTSFSKRLINLTLRLNLARKGKIFTNILSNASSGLISIENLELIRINTYKNLGYVGELTSGKNILHFGYFQTYRYAQNSIAFNQLQSLRPRIECSDLVELEKFALIENPLVVHVRLTDYLKEDKFGTPARSYYENAISLQMSTHPYGRIWVFSDDIEEAKKLIPQEWVSKVRWIGQVGSDATTTWHAMRLGSGYVIANSSYSWWAAYLAIRKDVTVVAPKPWFAGMEDPTDLIPPDWIQISSVEYKQNDWTSE